MAVCWRTGAGDHHPCPDAQASVAVEHGRGGEAESVAVGLRDADPRRSRNGALGVWLNARDVRA
jgi:hypothetical protein